MNEDKVFSLVVYTSTLLLNIYGLCLNVFYDGSFTKIFIHGIITLLLAKMISLLFKDENVVPKND